MQALCQACIHSYSATKVTLFIETQRKSWIFLFFAHILYLMETIGMQTKKNPEHDGPGLADEEIKPILRSKIPFIARQ